MEYLIILWEGTKDDCGMDGNLLNESQLWFNEHMKMKRGGTTIDDSLTLVFIDKMIRKGLKRGGPAFQSEFSNFVNATRTI